MNETVLEIPMLLYFKVEGLHGRQDVGLRMPGKNGVFIADNGSGKTTALFMLQCVLKCDFTKLTKFKFKRIVIEFSGDKLFTFTSDDCLQGRLQNRSALSRLMSRANLSEQYILDLASSARRSSLESLRRNPSFMNAVRMTGINSARLYQELRDFEASQADFLQSLESSPVSSLTKFLKTSFYHSVLYLPTYRRVEQDFSELFKVDHEYQERFGVNFKTDIHFGMKDVEARQDLATKHIGDHFIKSYGQISGQMLGQLAENPPVSDEMRARLLGRNNIELVLGRVGENVSAAQKDIILKMYDDGTLVQNGHLSFFLSSLIEAYDQVRKFDTALQRYAHICNSYLINKEMRYDSLNATVAIYETVGGTKLDLHTLSSGEKQILGVMSELYLGNHDSYVIIFDEPELSLSIDWQQKILVDVASSDKAHMLIAVTHSPFVFQNELDSFASSLEVSFSSPDVED